MKSPRSATPPIRNLLRADVIILGAGAAGLMAAAAARARGKRVLILEANTRPGLKILISGGGRCNFTNDHVTPTDFVSENPHFCRSALTQFTPQDFVRWVEAAGIPYYEKTLGQLFCRTSSKAILDLLLQRALGDDAQLKTGVPIAAVEKVGDDFIVRTAGAEYHSRYLIVATGGLSFPKLGASDLGYRIAQHFGHAITPLAPALDGFVFAESERERFAPLAGISAEVTVHAGPRAFTENILFTHVGLSGPAALKGSLFWYPGQTIEIDFLPHIADGMKWLSDLRRDHGKKTVAAALATALPSRLAEQIASAAQLDTIKMGDLSKIQQHALVQGIKHWTFIPAGTVGYAKAEVTRGGVATDHISSKTMESKIVPGLYFIGEVLDVTGLLGGYNFQWAWSSGWVAGNHVG